MAFQSKRTTYLIVFRYLLIGFPNMKVLLLTHIEYIEVMVVKRLAIRDEVPGSNPAGILRTKLRITEKDHSYEPCTERPEGLALLPLLLLLPLILAITTFHILLEWC